MDVNSVRLVFFSPTKTTERTLEAIAQGVQADVVEQFDLTSPEARTRAFEGVRDDLVIIGAPVYGGRIPPEAVYRLRRIRGSRTPACVVAVYGNRAYEDALLELRDLAVELGFRPIAGGAFIGEHSYHSAATPIASGRPDARDLAEAKRFGKLIRAKLGEISTLDEVSSLQVPGEVPYREWKPPAGESPVTDKVQCTLCGTCASVCPTAAIALEDQVLTDCETCILCSACVKSCPTGARAWDSPWVRRAAHRLSTDYRERREPEVFL